MTIPNQPSPTRPVPAFYAAPHGYWIGRDETATPVYSQVVGLAGASTRVETYLGQDHLVVPVVALVGDTVVRPSASKGPEFIPSHVLAAAPTAWNGRPVLPNHPPVGEPTANTPAGLEAMQFGQVFNARYVDGRLKFDAWLNLARAEELGELPQSVVTRLQAGEAVDVSVGVWALQDRLEGTSDGKPYSFIWRAIAPDHLAMLPAGTQGACNQDMGCGAPRIMEGGSTVTANGTDKGGVLSTLLSLLDIGGKKQDRQRCVVVRAEGDTTGVSDTDMRNRLWELLNDSVPGFEWVDAIYRDSNTVVYSVIMESEGFDPQTFSRTFEFTDDLASVTLNDDSSRVEFTVAFTPVSAQSTDTNTIVHACGSNQTCACGSQLQDEGATMDPTKVTRIAALIASDKSPFTADDTARLGEFSDEVITQLAAGLEEATPTPTPVLPPVPTVLTPTTPAPVTETPTPVADTSELSVDEWLAKPGVPPAIVSMVKSHEEAVATRRTELIAHLSQAVVQTHLTAEQLEEKGLDELETYTQLCASRELVGVEATTTVSPDFGLRPGAVKLTKRTAPPPPDSWGLNTDTTESN